MPIAGGDSGDRISDEADRIVERIPPLLRCFFTWSLY
jgi:hypothetical protein